MLGYLTNCNKVFLDIRILNGSRSTVMEVFDADLIVLSWENPTLLCPNVDIFR